MKKETIAAIFFGIIIGLGGAFIVIRQANQTDSSKMKPIPTDAQKSVVGKAGESVQLLEIQAPTTTLASSKNSVEIKGKASKDSLVVVHSHIKETVLKNDKESFSLDFPLALGENKILVTVYPKDSKIPPQSKELRVYYITE